MVVFANQSVQSPEHITTQWRGIISGWAGRKAAVGAAAGKTVDVALSAPFDMGDFGHGSSPICIREANTNTTIMGNGTVFIAPEFECMHQVSCGNSFDVANSTALAI